MRLQASYGARRGAAALLLGLLATSPLAAQENSPFGDPDERQQQLEPPIPLPEGLRGTIRPQDGEAPLVRINTIQEVFRAIKACWKVPEGTGYTGQQITVRLSFKRNGEILGKPRITFYDPGTVPEVREAFATSVREAFDRCVPLPFTESFGAAVAGRIFAIRFLDGQPI